MKTRRLTKEEHSARLASGVCPRCGDHRIVRVIRTQEDKDGLVRFMGSFYTCGGPAAHNCYHLSSENAKQLSESADGTTPVQWTSNIATAAPVIRRRRETTA